MPVLLLTFVVISALSSGEAIRCYLCDTYTHGVLCSDPMDYSYVGYLDCKKVYGYEKLTKMAESNSSEVEDMAKKYQQWTPGGNPGYAPASYSPTDFECLQYEKIYDRDGKKEFVRKCQERNRWPNYCGQLQNIGQFEGYRVTKCNTCYTDYCNSGSRLQIGIVSSCIVIFILKLLN